MVAITGFSRLPCLQPPKTGRKLSTRASANGFSTANGSQISPNGAINGAGLDGVTYTALQSSPVNPTPMDPKLLELMKQVATGGVSPEEAAAAINEQSSGLQKVQDFALTDSWRANRTGFPEVVMGVGKTPEQIAAIMQKLAENDEVVMATRVEPEVSVRVQQLLPQVMYNDAAKMLILKSGQGKRVQKKNPGTIAVLSAGTADRWVAEEARLTAEVMGCYCFRLHDVGIEGMHRVMGNLDAIRAADVIIVVAGMDGSLPSVICGLVESPVIAVPTSVGYGAAFGGLSPLLSALTCGSPGMGVVNIDNGFGAAMLAARIMTLARKHREQVKAQAQ